MNTEQLRQIITSWASQLPHRTRIYLFGSRLKGTEKPTSDLDLAVEFLEPLPEADCGLIWIRSYEQWEEYLSHQIGLPVHLNHYGPNHSPKLEKAFSEGYMILFDSSD